MNTSSSDAKSSAPASKAIIIISSSSNSAFSITISPFFWNMKPTHPDVPMFPPPLVKALLTLPADLFLLSVNTSTITATPDGPYPS